MRNIMQLISFAILFIGFVWAAWIYSHNLYIIINPFKGLFLYWKPSLLMIAGLTGIRLTESRER